MECNWYRHGHICGHTEPKCVWGGGRAGWRERVGARKQWLDTGERAEMRRESMEMWHRECGDAAQRARRWVLEGVYGAGKGDRDGHLQMER